MNIRIQPEIEKLEIGQKYETGHLAIADWVGGGNFEGYVYQKNLIFYETDNEVVLETVIINQERADPKKRNQTIKGKYGPTEKNTITCYFKNFQMRGKILGDRNEYFVFTVTYQNWTRGIHECYVLSK